ncbi:glycosyltransferase involved in cell wall biosynthesis [Paraburkholderia atlantica]|uniref:glycosyltransferase family 4 protein n=1 Tax=Paraburkholderia atlantica TaxID=2654982 RepID=UPI003D230C01
MELVLAVDAIVPPLTGIGRYAWELAQYYSHCDAESIRVRFDFHGTWVDDVAGLLNEGPPRVGRRAGKFLPARAIRWWRRHEARDRVYHGPNYFLPEDVERGIVTVHDLSVFKYPQTHPIERLKQFERNFASTLKRASHIITDSEATRREVAEYFGWSLSDISSIRLGVPQQFRRYETAELGEPLSKYGLIPGRYSLCISTLEPRKRIDQLLHVYRNLPATVLKRYPLVIGGSKGWLSDELSAQIREGEEEGWLRYLGFIPENVLPIIYAGSRAFLYPSMYEGFGLPVLEALASGIPTLTANCSSLPEVANGAAWLVEVDDHGALLDGIVKVLCDDEWRSFAVARGLAVASETTWAKCAQQTLEVCRQFG